MYSLDSIHSPVDTNIADIYRVSRESCIFFNIYTRFQEYIFFVRIVSILPPLPHLHWAAIFFFSSENCQPTRVTHTHIVLKILPISCGEIKLRDGLQLIKKKQFFLNTLYKSIYYSKGKI